MGKLPDMGRQTALAGDVGGTNCRFALAEMTAQGTIELHDSQIFPVKDYPRFEDALAAYLAQTGHKPDRAAFAFAGPKVDGVIEMTNTDWKVSESALEKEFAFDETVLLNDFVAMANGARILPDDGFQTLIAGKVNYNRPVAVIGPGTGMGVSCILPAAGLDHPHILATEGGHSAFAPQSDLEMEVLKALQNGRGFVSAETVLSGPGLLRLYQTLCMLYGETCKLVRPDEVAVAAEANPASLARRAIILFNSMLGGFAGNTALTLGAFGGVVIGGGVARHLAPYIAESDFQARFQNRGPGTRFLAGVPVRLIMVRFVPLYGAAAMVLEK